MTPGDRELMVAAARMQDIRISTEEAFGKFLSLSVADGCASPRTIQAYREGLVKFLGWCGSRDPREMGIEEIERYRAWLVFQGYKPKTVNLRLTAVRVLYAAFRKWGIRMDDPAADIHSPKANMSTPAGSVLRKALSPDETRLFLDSLPKSWAPQDVRDTTIIRLMLFHGLRAGEISSLNSSSVDCATFTMLNVLGKGSKMRSIVLSPESRQDLIAWARIDSHPQVQTGPADTESTIPLFHRLDVPGYNRLSVRSIERIVDWHLTRAGLKRAGRSAHALRHTHAVMAVLGGVHQEALAEEMGHSDTRTTYIYTRAAAAWQENPSSAVMKALEVKSQ